MEELDLHPRIPAALRKAKLLDQCTILSMSAPDIVRATKLSLSDVKLLHKAVAQLVKLSPAVTALQMLKSEVPDNLVMRNLSLGCKVLDRFFRGGITTRGITEISGESACGKTQICMQLCLTVQLPVQKGGLNGGAVYLCTEDAFPNKRLMQMLQFFKMRCTGIGVNKPSYTDDIFIEHAADIESLQFCISRRIPLLLKRGTVKLVIVDSVAALFRCEYGIKETVQRAKLMSSFAAELHRLSYTYNIPIVCVNQVSASMDKNKLSEPKVTPALGIAWANLVTCRLMLTRTSYAVDVEQKTSNGESLGKITAVVRTAEVVFAPHLPNSVIQFYIDQEGVKGLT